MKERSRWCGSSGLSCSFRSMERLGSRYPGFATTIVKQLWGFAPRFRPMYAPRHAGAGLANMGHPSNSLRVSFGLDVRFPAKLLARLASAHGVEGVVA
jgi:hypothetical protein